MFLTIKSQDVIRYVIVYIFYISFFPIFLMQMRKCVNNYPCPSEYCIVKLGDFFIFFLSHMTLLSLLFVIVRRLQHLYAQLILFNVPIHTLQFIFLKIK